MLNTTTTKDTSPHPNSLHSTACKCKLTVCTLNIVTIHDTSPHPNSLHSTVCKCKLTVYIMSIIATDGTVTTFPSPDSYLLGEQNVCRFGLAICVHFAVGSALLEMHVGKVQSLPVVHDGMASR